MALMVMSFSIPIQIINWLHTTKVKHYMATLNYMSVTSQFWFKNI